MQSSKRRHRDTHVCTACRQSKVRCNASDTHPDPCERCKARGTACTIDANFKRTPARQRVKAIESELNRLKQERALNELATSPLSATTTTATALPPLEPVSTNGQNAVLFGIDTSQKTVLQIIDLDAAVLGQLIFTPMEVQDRFIAFAKYMHHHMPLLDADLSVHQLYTHSRLLFWTVFIIGSRIVPVDPNQQTLLETTYTSLLQEVALDIPISLHTIQALLLISTWPLPQLWQLGDPSWTYSGIAMSGCGYLNLGRSANKFLYQGGQLSPNDIKNMSRTWLANFSILVSLALEIGVLPPNRDPVELASVEAALMQPSTPPVIAVEAAIMARIARFSSSIRGQDAASLEAMVESCVLAIDFVEARFRHAWNQHLASFAAGAKLHAYATSVVRMASAADMDHETRAFNSETHILQATLVAEEILTLFSSFIGNGAEVSKQDCERNYNALPKYHFRATVQAVFFLIRFACFNDDLTETIRERSLAHVHAGKSAFQRASSRPGGPLKGDEPGRAVPVLELWLKHGNAFRDFQISDRGSSSIFWDSLHKTYRLRGRPTHRTDLLYLIDPTRERAKDAALEREVSGADDPSAKIANNFSPASSAELWNDPFVDLFNFNWFDYGTQAQGQPAQQFMSGPPMSGQPMQFPPNLLNDPLQMP